MADDDRRFMAAALRLAERHSGLTGTNPSVGTILVRDGVVVGRGITAPGGRPHAETIALAEAGERAAGATAYVTLEPCSHHGRTPPCAEALIAAGVARVVIAASDPDPRVDGRGAAMLRAAGIVVEAGVLAAEARRSLAGYLSRMTRKRPYVTMKFAISADGMIGRRGEGQVAITGPDANRQTHLLRARSDAILVGIGTVAADDPSLTCRLPGLRDRSPTRIVLDSRLEIRPDSVLVRTARDVPVMVATLAPASEQASAIRAAGCELLACEAEPGTNRIALPELFEDLAARGLSSLMVEPGARLAATLLEQQLADRLIVVRGETIVGAGGVLAPLDAGSPEGFRKVTEYRFGPDRWQEFERLA
ncbi:bifunctional diaminohydroxyphosphoribosylaminopyrimidine deaminase/5-amino-6-(5-phosphoribosylamino)uracil reductase RibD [Aureimonas leprariae]|uniref:Riboflavin biosynthesis protein RibD n=1 Tax=Plantimonas leprariae TaxID=2615207 RepID=A0A7V7PQP1_9HYPH|nr:bifunctional diaminohydroxyphosphoribosylaminopyrimidine deaminase/5-amino-6-(5-phosphoribosylamino)uracil reductase RibD [Aureimonas leprariae]KAB0680710.1 bifunctional diaminohydroxyphosphoribosylaminopyrimidine deaminase/5-amino-6-(5-phosphoribosylamino)uracil reductase RibD [Aureimonas leprariae]